MASVTMPLDGEAKAEVERLSAAQAPDEGADAMAMTQLTRSDLERVNALIVERAGSQADMIPEIARRLIGSGGKRLRSMLTLVSGQMFGCSASRRILLAAAVEFMHTATLLHDDVVDESDMRRGEPAPRLLWGNQASVLVGDYLLGQAFRMMVEADSMEALDALSRAAATIAEGEVMQLSHVGDPDIDEERYMAVIRAKTAELFAVAAEVGALASGGSSRDAEAMREYGTNLGLVFQLVDDALDYGGSSEAIGKKIGDDFREGKVTLPVALCYRRVGESEREFWRAALKHPGSGEAELDHAISLLRDCGALSDTVSRARKYAVLARDRLSGMPSGAHRDALVEAVDFCLARAG